MSNKRKDPERKLAMLRRVEVLLSSGVTVVQACKRVGLSKQTYYSWRQLYGTLRHDQDKRLKDLQQENIRLRKLVSNQALDIATLKKLNLSGS